MTRLVVEQAERGVLRWHLAGGARRNVIGKALLADLDHAVASIGDDVGAVVLSADAPDFCAGFDLIEAHRDGPVGLIAEPEGLASLRACPVPIVAALTGNVLGGGLELALCADVRVSTPSTTFGLPAGRLGLVYSSAGLADIVEAFGPSAAHAMVVAGLTIDARAAARLGTVQLVPRRRLHSRARAIAAAIAAQPREAVRGNRALLQRMARRHHDDDGLHSASLSSAALLGAIDRFASTRR